ncbi:NAC domain-containing protein 68-like [Cornus florida]|uniref:NAC domain-containing protein 68-like n=1 Tax=Cornus florida TaxID=4283 RepID=UPI00289EFA24|nr:NAC domain-containing protein 68-like [Cornus florida]
MSINHFNQTEQCLSTCGYFGNTQVLAVGYRFEPTDEELISGYLKRKLNGEQELPSNAVIDMDIYACEPWFLSYDIHGSMGNMDNEEHEHQRDRYYFVNRQKKCAATDGGKRPERGVKGKFDVGGYWKASSGDKCIRNTQHLNVIGYIKTLAFYKYKNKNKNRKECIKTDWIMHEYCLSRETFQKWVLCRIRDNSRKSKEEGKHKNEGTQDFPKSSAITCVEEGKPDMELETAEQEDHFENMQEKSDLGDVLQEMKYSTCEEEGKFDMELGTSDAKTEEYLSWMDLISFDDHEEHFSDMSYHELQEKSDMGEVLQELKSTCEEQENSDMELGTSDAKTEEYLSWMDLKSVCDDEEQGEQFSYMSFQDLQEKSDMGEVLQELKSTCEEEEKSDNYKDISWMDLMNLSDDEIPFVCFD